MTEGTVLRARGGTYTVALESGERIEASLRGRLKRGDRRKDRVVVGDRVQVAESADGAFTVEGVLPRATEILRRAPGGREGKVVAANVDRLLAVVAAARPDPTRETVDRLLLIAEANGLDPVLVLNKVDLVEGRDGDVELARTYRDLGYPVLETSAVSGAGIGDLRDLLCQGSSVLFGPSGVGKSSLLNAVEPSLDLRTGELSRKPGRGRHTTVSSRLIELPCGGMVADTPGFSDVGLWGVDPASIDACFRDFIPHLDGCRFRGCAHLEEPGCAVKEAVSREEITPERYESYVRIRREAEEAVSPPWKS